MTVPHELPVPGPGAPTQPIELPRRRGRRHRSPRRHRRSRCPTRVIDRLSSICPTTTDGDTLGEASRDWWPQAMIWALDGQVPARAGAVVSPTSAEEVGAVLAVCNEAVIPVTAAAGRSGVCGASVPLHGGVVLDLCGLSGIVDVDGTSLVLDVAPGTFGDHLEHELRREHGVTLGHWPQSVALSTVGGWLACRSAGQLSTRYGKIEDMVLGLDVALADGRHISTGGAPRAAVGPDLNQLFVGSEGTLGIITGARLRLHPAPVHERRGAYAFASFEDGLDAMRRILQRGGTPAVLRLYDAVEADRTYKTGDRALLLVLDEGEAAAVDATMELVAEVCREAEPRRPGARRALAGAPQRRRRAGGPDLAGLRGGHDGGGRPLARPAVHLRRRRSRPSKAVDGTLAASAHQSHSYTDGACLYFTFAAKTEPDDRDRYYREAWDAGTRAVLAAGGALSHHHGVGLNRGRFVAEALGPAFEVLVATKAALDPNGILNPGKLGLPSAFGPPAY